MLTIDGSAGEGGGQILRTALSLAMVTATPFRIDRVRAGRKKPGLLRQHLTCVRAAHMISGARMTGAELGSTTLTFEPQHIRGGVFELNIGSAGSTTLVFQTMLPALLAATEPSRVVLAGGTHNPQAPTFDYVDRVFLPLLARMGAEVSVKLHRHGFAPAGGGKWHARITPTQQLTPLMLEERGALVTRAAIADVANISIDVAEREAETMTRLMSWPPDAGAPRTIDADGHGNVARLELGFENLTEIVTGFGARDRSAENVAADVIEEARAYLVAGAPVGPHLSDQLLLPLALAGAGAFVTTRPTAHTSTNIAVIEKFLPVEFHVEPLDPHRWRIGVSS